MKSTGLKAFLTAALVAIVLAACSNPFQVIEDLDFAASLGIDLTEMTRLNSGVYYRDTAVGDGDTALLDSVPVLDYVGYLADGTKFGEGTDFNFQIGAGQVISGFEEGVFGMRENGRRLVVIPPERGYGERDQANIPAGSVLIFDLTLTAVGEAPPPEMPTG